MRVSAPCGDTVASPVRANVTKSVMKTTDGKFLKIQTIDDTLKLCVEEIQNADNKGTAGVWCSLKGTSGRTGAHCDPGP